MSLKKEKKGYIIGKERTEHRITQIRTETE